MTNNQAIIIRTEIVINDGQIKAELADHIVDEIATDIWPEEQ